MSSPPRYFTVEEANMAVGIIRPLMGEILEIRQELLDKQPEVWPVVEKAAGNGGNELASQLVRQFERLDNLMHAILATGAVVKDINNGLVDFLSQRDGRDIYLCWKYNEARVGHWHELDAGFAGRQLLA